jgi:hypothetical protein
MTITRVLASLVIFAGVGLGAASPASADEMLQGIYTYTQGSAPQETWTVYPICVNVVGDLREPLYLPVGCTLHVTSSTGTGGDAKLTNGLWTYLLTQRDGMQCPDGSKAPLTQIWAFDGNALTGTLTTIHDEVCGLQPALAKEPFTLAFKEPLPIPVEPYPLQCEPGGLRLCR